MYQLCLGLNSVPYLLLRGKLGSGTVAPKLSVPVKLSHHLLSNAGDGLIAGSPSAYNFQTLCESISLSFSL